MYEPAVIMILRYMDECLFEPAVSWPQDAFIQRVHTRWATNEILDSIMNHPLVPPIEIIEEFMIEMEYFSCIAEGKSAEPLFLFARCAAEEVLLLFQ